jgi:hypothetical protein
VADASPRPDVATLASGAIDRLDRHADRLGADGRRAVVEVVAEQLAALATEQGCTEAGRRVLLDWRDRLSSYILAAQALDELDVHADAADQFLRRGLEELRADAGASQLAPG